MTHWLRKDVSNAASAATGIKEDVNKFEVNI